MSSGERQTVEKPEKEARLLERDKIREDIRSMLRFHYRPHEIYGKLKLSRPAYYRHLKRIRKEDQHYIFALRGPDFATSVRQTIETLEDLSRQLALIAQDASKDYDKISAIELRYQIELDILNVEKVGPSSVPIGRRMTQVEEFNAAFQNQRK